MRLLTVCLFALLLPFPTLAAPVQVPYSGQLLDNGLPVTGMRLFSFNLYADSLGGLSLAAQQESLMVDGGVFHTQLRWDSSAWDSPDKRYVGTQVGDNPEMVPRVLVGAVPLAVRSLSATRADTATALAVAPVQPLMVWVDAGDFITVTPSARFAWTPVLSITINAPAAGQVVVTASGAGQGPDPGQQIQLNDGHVSGSIDAAYAYQGGIACTKVFTVQPGPSTFWLYARDAQAQEYQWGSLSFQSARLVATWYPQP